MLTGSDGYQYADITQRLLGKPLENGRNRAIRLLVQARYSPEEINAYCFAYDSNAREHADCLSRSPG